jgi:hypothetical protein
MIHDKKKSYRKNSLEDVNSIFNSCILLSRIPNSDPLLSTENKKEC